MKLAWIYLCFILLSRPALALTTDEAFADARDAYKNRDELALATDLQQLQAQGYVLAPYADYWLMLLRLSQASNETVRDFLSRYAELPFADRVRGEWLKVLGKRQDWETFFSEQPNFQRDDVAVTCYSLDGRAQLGDSDALTLGKPLWLVADEQPANCNLLFDHMQKAKVLTDDDIWARVRLALQESKIAAARSALLRLPGFDAANLKLLDRAYDNPQRTLEKTLISTRTRFGRELTLFMLQRLARSQPAIAVNMWKHVETAFEPEERSYLWGRMALEAARKHDPAALGWFNLAQTLVPDQAAPLDKEQLSWKARAAMRVKDWPVLQTTIAGMTSPQQEEATWRYWKARAMKEQNDIAGANAILVPLSRERTYYGLLAEEELGEAISEPPGNYKASDEEVRDIKSLPGIQRALELQRLDMRFESRTEWAWATRGFADKQMIAAAELAAEQGWFDLAILTAEKTTEIHDFSLRYPTPFRDIMKISAQQQGLDEAWVYGLIRQESRFIIYAKSGVGASGLMQVMPATAKWIAKKMGLAGYQHGKIAQLDTNIQMGTFYMRHTLDLMNGQALMATAAYNAGPGRAKHWAAAEPLEGAIYAETIPFAETRDYVKKVMGNAYFYATRLGIKGKTLKQRLGIVAGTGSVLSPEETEPN